MGGERRWGEAFTADGLGVPGPPLRGGGWGCLGELEHLQGSGCAAKVEGLVLLAFCRVPGARLPVCAPAVRSDAAGAGTLSTLLQLGCAKGPPPTPPRVTRRECRSGGATLTCQINHLDFSLRLAKGQESLGGPEINGNSWIRTSPRESGAGTEGMGVPWTPRRVVGDGGRCPPTPACPPLVATGGSSCPAWPRAAAPSAWRCLRRLRWPGRCSARRLFSVSRQGNKCIKLN